MHTSIALWQNNHKLITHLFWTREELLNTTEKVTFPTDTSVFLFLNILNF